MRICVVGAGAIGGLLAAHLAEAGNEVTVIDVGAHLAAIQRDGLRIIRPDGTSFTTRRLRALGSIAEAGAQDLVILAVKANVIPQVAGELPRLYDEGTCLLPVQNGLPWWYFQRHGGPFEGQVIETVDPGGRIAATIDPARIIGCVTFPAGAVLEPGVIRHVEGNRFPLGELDGSESERAARIAELLNGAGFKSFVISDIRAEIWLKLWGNLSFNPISALTHATLEEICTYPPTRQLAHDMMAEAQAVAGKLGITFRLPIEKRIEGARKVGAHKTSMLQDVEAGRALEIDAIIAATIELAERVEVPVPAIRAVHALVALLDRKIQEAHSAVQLCAVA